MLSFREEFVMGPIFRRDAVTILVAALFMGTVLSGPALAHEHRHVGPFEMTVGWADEPAFVGFKNGVQLILNASEKPVVDLGNTLKVEVIFGNEKLGPLPLDPAFDLEEKFGRPGDYRASLIPTRAGTYSFHFVGAFKGQKVDQSFSCSEKTFDCVSDSSGIEFPAKDPSRAELAGRLERLGPRIDTAVGEAKDAASTAKTLGIIGILLAGVALAVVVFGGRGRRRP
jgi:hypothetical protein